MSVPVEGGPQFLEPRLGPQTHWQNQPLAKKGTDMCVYTVCMLVRFGEVKTVVTWHPQKNRTD